MKILLAPAETKNEGGTQPCFCQDNYIFPDLFSKREEIFSAYESHVSELNLEDLSAWFGIKKLDDVKKYQKSLKDKPTMKAIERYNGVAFDAIEYTQLNQKEQSYIDNNVILFSNLFGPIKASDLIPDYKYKQGAKLPHCNVEKFFMENFSQYLDNYLGEEILDLRAGYYEKFYKVKQSNVITLKFIKEGKVVSHWAKHYRGAVLNALAKNNIESFSEFMNLEIPGLALDEIQEKKNIKTLIMNII